MQLKFRERIAYKNAKMAVLVALLLGVLLSGVQISTDYVNQSDKMLNTLEALKDSSATPALESVWNLDEDLAQSVVEGLFTNVGVLEAKIELENGEALAEKSRNIQHQIYSVITNALFGERVVEKISLSVEESSLTRVYGYLYITYDPYEEGVSFLKRSMLILFSGIIKNLFLAIVLFILFYRYLTRPLEHLTKTVSTIRPGAENNQLEPYADGYQGEFQIMFSKLETVIDEMNKSARTRDEIQSSLNNINVALESKVKERTKEYKKQKENADRASLVKSQFLATMSHEIRTPLNSIIGLSSIGNAKKGVEKLENYLMTIHESAKSLNALLDEISDFSQIESHQIVIRNIPLSITRLINEIDNSYSSSAIAKGLNFNTTVDPLIPPFVLGDYVRVRQVLSNLVSNAIKFTEKGSVDVSVELLQDNSFENSVTLLFSVVDTGIGIQSEDLTKLFESFFQEDMSATRQYSGAGLGLTLSNDLVELMGGTIDVVSEVNKGSTFTFKLKFEISFEESVDESSQFASYFNRLNGKRLLLVEDIEVNRYIIQEMLREVGLEVFIAVNGREAVNRCREEDFDVVLMDIQMPIMDGCEATYIIRHELDNKDLPIIALTANALPEDRDRCIRAGMNDFLAKPVDVDALLDKIIDWV